MRVLLACYLTTVITIRLFLRESCGQLHWAVAMALEDGMSLLSFALGLYVLHHSNGAPLALFAKSLSAHLQGAAAAAASFAPSMSGSEDGEEEEKRFRLFSVVFQLWTTLLRPWHCHA